MKAMLKVNKTIKNKPAFTLMEVLLALTILATSLYVLSDLQMKSIFRVFKDKRKIEHTFLTKKQLYLAYIKNMQAGKPVVEKLEDPKLEITTEVIELSKKSVFKKSAEKINLVKSTGTWQQEGESQQQFEIVTMTLKKAEEKKKK